MATDGRLKKFLEVLFNELIKTPKAIEITLKWPPDVFVRWRKAAQDMKNTWISKISISDLSLELIDCILEKSYLLSILRQKESPHNQKDEVVIKQLTSVDVSWFQRITRKRFKNVVWSKLKKYYEHKLKFYLIYKSNQQFFEEIHQISEKTTLTPSTDYLRKSEVAKWKRKRSSKKRHAENQMLRTAFLATRSEERSLSVLEDFLSSCDPEEHKVIDEIMNTGGGTARVEIKMSHPLTKFELIPQFFEDGAKILRSFADRDAVVWIWCHSNKALQKLNKRDGLKKLIETVDQSIKASLLVMEHRNNIDYDHMKKKIDAHDRKGKIRCCQAQYTRGTWNVRTMNQVSIPLEFVNFKTTLHFKRETLSEIRPSDSDIYSVIDVTKFTMKIYVLRLIFSEDHSGHSTDSIMICVFEDRSPYRIVEEILLRRLPHCSTRHLGSIVSSVKENCLYVLASASSIKDSCYIDEVIRVEVKENEINSQPESSTWLKLEVHYRPLALSISRDGDLMMVSISSPIILRIYDSDARVRLSVKLDTDILVAPKVVETSNGNFIIVHPMKRPSGDTDNGDRAKGANEKQRDFLRTVSEVSRDGKTIIRRFIPQSQEQQPDIPYNFDRGDLCIDSRDRVFVADAGNHRVIVLDSYLRWIGSRILQVKERDGTARQISPSKLFYDEDSHEVIVAEHDEVHIYD